MTVGIGVGATSGGGVGVGLAGRTGLAAGEPSALFGEVGTGLEMKGYRKREPNVDTKFDREGVLTAGCFSTTGSADGGSSSTFRVGCLVCFWESGVRVAVEVKEAWEDVREEMASRERSGLGGMSEAESADWLGEGSFCLANDGWGGGSTG